MGGGLEALAFYTSYIGCVRIRIRGIYKSLLNPLNLQIPFFSEVQQRLEQDKEELLDQLQDIKKQQQERDKSIQQISAEVRETNSISQALLMITS